MKSLSESTLSCIDNMHLTEFQSVVSVCESLIENYEKAADIIKYSNETDCSRYETFIESFVSEEDESWWRKNKSDGNREHILISILLLPLRMIQALIKLIKNSRVKQESKSLDNKLDKIEKMRDEDELSVKSVVAEKDIEQSSPVEESGDKKKKKKKRAKVKIDASGPEVQIESNIDITETEKTLETVNEKIGEEKEFYDAISSEENVTKVIRDGLNNGTINRVQAKQIMDLVHWDTDARKTTTITQFKSEKNKSMDLLSRTERVCEEYRKSIERVLTALRDHPSGDTQADAEVTRLLTEKYQESKALVITTADALLYLEGQIAVCNQAADMIINGKE